MRYVVILVVAVLFAILVGFGLGRAKEYYDDAQRVDRVIAMSWEKGKSKPGYYGAQVYLKSNENGYSVKAIVWMGLDRVLLRDCGEIGITQTDNEAVANWGRIEWQPDGLHIGHGVNPFFMPWDTIEKHR